MVGAQQTDDLRRRRLIGRAAILVAFVAVAVAAAAALLIDRTPMAHDNDAPSVDWSSVRAEYWRDVVIDVPSSWGYGGAPIESDGDSLICDPRPVYDAAGDPVESAGFAPEGYVGRPLVLSTDCVPYPLPADADDLADVTGATAADGSRVPYVWLGGDVAEGAEELGGGFVQETTVFLGVSVTVGSYDQDTRARVLGSVRSVSTCQPRLSLRGPLPEPRYGKVGGDGGAAASLRVCGYVNSGADSDTGADEVGLAWGVELGGSGLSPYREVLDTAGLQEATCKLPEAGEYEWVVVEFVDPGGSVLRRDVVHSTCGVVQRNAPRLRLPADGTGLAYGPAYERVWSTGEAAGLRAVLPSLVAGAEVVQ